MVFLLSLKHSIKPGLAYDFKSSCFDSGKYSFLCLWTIGNEIVNNCLNRSSASYNIPQMKKIALFFTLIFISYSYLCHLTAQEKKSESWNISGKDALQFRVVGTGSSSSFRGTVLSYKKQVNRRHAFSTGLSLRFDKTDTDATSELETLRELLNSQEQLRSIDGTRNSTTWSAGIVLLYLNSIIPEGRTKLYWGIGPDFIYTSDKSIIDSEIVTTTQSENGNGITDQTFNGNSRVRQFDIGLSLIAGVEWFISSRLSITGEYGLTGGAGWGNRKSNDFSITVTESSSNNMQEPVSTITQTSESESDDDFTRYFIQPNNARLGISIYF